MVGYLSLGCW